MVKYSIQFRLKNFHEEWKTLMVELKTNMSLSEAMNIIRMKRLEFMSHDWRLCGEDSQIINVRL